MVLMVHRNGPQDGAVEDLPEVMARSGELEYANTRVQVQDVYRRTDPVEYADTEMGRAEVWVHVGSH